MDADEFLTTIFDQAQGVVVVCNAEDSFRSRRWAPGKPLSGTVYFCISTVSDRNPRDEILQRRTQDLVLTYDIVLDDVGTKVLRETLKGLLAPCGLDDGVDDRPTPDGKQLLGPRVRERTKPGALAPCEQNGLHGNHRCYHGLTRR